MTKDELLKKLEDLRTSGDVETAHHGADQLLLGYIDDQDIEKAYDKVRKWYA